MRIRSITFGQIIPFLLKNETILSFLQDKLRNFSSFSNEMSDMLEEINVDVIPFTNGTGSTINDRTFIIDSSEKWCGVVQGGAVANGETGDLRVEEGILLQVDDLVSGEDTFATIGQPVYYDNTAGEFSDTATVGYYLVGQLRTVKDSEGMGRVTS